MFRRILLAVDGSEAGQVGACMAIALAGDGPTAVHVVHVNEFVAGARGLTAETESEAADLVRRVVVQLREAGLDASGAGYRSACFGVAPAIVDAAHQWGADVILLGSHRRRGLKRLWSRGVREQVSRTTCLPVLVAPPPLHLGRRPLHQVAERTPNALTGKLPSGG